LYRVSGVLDIISNPKSYFDEHRQSLEEVVGLVRRAFGTDLDFDDIYRHVTLPQEVCLLRNEDGSLKAMRSHNRKTISGIPCLFLEGAVIDPSLHGHGIYGRILSEINEREAVICLKTQNPRVYAAIEGYCSAVYPGMQETPGAIREIKKAIAADLKCAADENGVIQGYYGRLLYGEEPAHERSVFFKDKLKMNLERGDALIVVGVK